MRGTKVPLGSDHYRVVFFNNTAKPRAEEIADWLQKNTSAPVDVKKSALPAPTGQIEVWYPKH